jgi:type I restriction-modification system DNA methylase subunit
MSNVSGIIKSIQDIMRKDVGVDGDAQRIGQLVWMFFLKILDDQEEQLELTEDGVHQYDGGYTEYVARTGHEAPGLHA